MPGASWQDPPRGAADRHRGAGRGRQAHAGRRAGGGAGRARGPGRPVAFPRYDADVHAELVRDALYGRLGDLGARCTGWRAVRAGPPGRRRRSCAARWPSTTCCWSTGTSPPTRPTARPGCTRTPTASSWPGCGTLEIERFALPVPDHQLLLAVPRAVAAERAAHRERTEPRPRARRLRVRRRPAAAHRGGVRAAGRPGVAVAVDGARRRAGPTPARSSPLTCSGESTGRAGGPS